MKMILQSMGVTGSFWTAERVLQMLSASLLACYALHLLRIWLREEKQRSSHEQSAEPVSVEHRDEEVPESEVQVEMTQDPASPMPTPAKGARGVAPAGEEQAAGKHAPRTGPHSRVPPCTSIDGASVPEATNRLRAPTRRVSWAVSPPPAAVCQGSLSPAAPSAAAGAGRRHQQRRTRGQLRR